MYTQKKLLPALPEYSAPSKLTRRLPDEFYRSNNVLCQTELTDIRNRITEASLRISEFNSAMDQLRLLLSDYEKGRDECVTFVTDHRPFLSPIRSVPPEVWRQVFILAQIEYDESHSHRPFYRKAPQLYSYGAVSSLWRRVALDTPALWSTINICKAIDYRGKSPFERPFSRSAGLLLDLWLLRSKEHPLKIDVQARSGSETSYRRICNVRHLLNNHAHRWRDLHITAEWDFLQDWPAITQAASLLEKCAFDLSTYDIDGEAYANPASFITDAPKLRTVKIDGVQSGEFRSFPALVPWSLITSLELEGTLPYDEYDQFDFLGKCTSLEIFEVHRGYEEDDEPIDCEPFDHENLKQLHIIGAPRLLSLLTAPSLTSLRLDSVSKTDPKSTIADFIQRSPCLRDLTMDEEHHHIIDSLRRTGIAQIQSLTLNGHCAEWDSISKAVFALTDKSVMPGLESLTVATQCFKRRDDKNTVNAAISVRDAILSLCRSRLGVKDERGYTGSHSIKKISVQFSAFLWKSDPDRPEVETEVFKGLKELVVEGLTVDLDITFDNSEG